MKNGRVILLCTFEIIIVVPYFFLIMYVDNHKSIKINRLNDKLIPVFILAGNEDNHKISDEFKIRPDPPSDGGVSCP